MNKRERERLQASLDYHNKKAIEQDAAHRAEMKQELANKRRITILRCWGGDQC